MVSEVDKSTGRSVHIYRRFLCGSGGGQFYSFALADALSNAGYDVSCGSVDGVDRAEAASGSGLGLRKVQFVRHRDESQVEFRGDLLIHVANADLALRSRGARQVALVFAPEKLHPVLDLARVARNRLLGRAGYDWIQSRVSRYDEFWAISKFTQTLLRRRWRVSSRLLEPPLLQDPGATPLPVSARRPVVLLLGRISPEKRLLEVIDAFSNSALSETHTLRLVGEHAPSDPYGRRVLAAASRTRAEIEPASDREAVLEALAQARFLWHGMGIGVDPLRHPERVEQFGMAVLEAMAWGCIPVAADRGGPATLLPRALQVRAFPDFARVTARIEQLSAAGVDDLQAELVGRAANYRWPRFSAAALSLVRALIGPP